MIRVIECCGIKYKFKIKTEELIETINTDYDGDYVNAFDKIQNTLDNILNNFKKSKESFMNLLRPGLNNYDMVSYFDEITGMIKDLKKD